ncbi:MAG: hypothetical protein ACKVY0_28060 [Prosthecobacter sp.]|uniref:hypothetical protein n=1 Tax=Prosthecobacter sp. TaxID=1965333 RepID=UPI0039026F68
MSSRAPADYGKNVFINCPFDEEYLPLLRAITFTVTFCGFNARCALEVQDASEVRLAKILRLILESRLSIHDISRTALDRENGLPRFNMPFELGICVGAAHFGGKSQAQKRLLVLDVERYRFQKFLSDIAGQDIKAHHNDQPTAISVTREWLNDFHSGGSLPGGKAIAAQYRRFCDRIPTMLKAIRLHESEVLFSDWKRLIEQWLKEPEV